jgi:quinol monooxygenase YgiN
VIVVAGTVSIRPEKRDAARAAAQRVAEATRAEPGNRAYRFGLDVDDENVVHVFEEWESAQALDEHFTTPHLAEFMTVLADVLEGEPALVRYEVADSAALGA